MDGIYPTSLNWTDLESIARVNKIKLTRTLVNKLNVAEGLTIEESYAKRK